MALVLAYEKDIKHKFRIMRCHDDYDLVGDHAT